MMRFSNMKNIRLDDMTIKDVKELYDPMFNNLISQDILDNVYNKYLFKYNEMKEAEKNGYDAPSGMGRKFNYLKNILYGWYIEELFFLLIKRNSNVSDVKFTGKDAEHDLKYNHENKKVTIAGIKDTTPDFLITTSSGKKVYLELKTAAKEIYSVKIGNVKQLQKTMGFTDIYSMIIMVDLVNEKYDIKDLSFFTNSFPFVNQRMEGQLCYDFPIPEKDFSLIINENFDNYIKNDMFNVDDVKKYKALKIAEDLDDKEKIREVKNKIKLDELISEFEFKNAELIKEVDKLVSVSPNIENKTWDDILSELINT